MAPVSVVVVDDHVLFRRGVTAVLNASSDIRVVAEAADGREALTAAREFRPNVVVMDLSMPEVGGVEATHLLLQELPETNVLILTISEKDEDLFSALKAGAKGYLLKGADPEELVRAVGHVADGGVIISAAMAPKLLSEVGAEEAPADREVSGLSPRETEILELVAAGLTDKEIAGRLSISVNTVKTHLKNTLAKLHLKSRVQMALYRARVGPPQQQKT